MYIIKIIGIVVLSYLILVTLYHQIKMEILYKEDQEGLKRSRIIFAQLFFVDIIFSGGIYYLVISLWYKEISFNRCSIRLDWPCHAGITEYMPKLNLQIPPI